MQLQTLTHTTAGGWSQPVPTELDGPQTLVLVFAAPELADGEAATLASLAQAFPASVLLGCSTAGEIAGQRVHDASISVAVARFEHTPLRLAITPVACPADSQAAGARLAQQLAGEGLRAVFVLSDGLHVNGTPLVAGLAAGVGPGVVITGGLAGDAARFGRTWILSQGQPQSQLISAVGLYGPRLQVGHGCNAGWSDFGPERRITRAEGNVLYELDGKPALDLYKTYLGERAQGLPGTALLFPLAVRREGSTAEPLVRTILGVSEAEQSLTFAGDLPLGGIARLMRANNDKLIDSASMAAGQAIHGIGADSDALAISVSCVGRRLVLGERTEEEVEAVLDGVGSRCAQVGFYSYGEISPLVSGGASELHNQTMTVTVFSER